MTTLCLATDILSSLICSLIKDHLTTTLLSSPRDHITLNRDLPMVVDLVVVATILSNSRPILNRYLCSSIQLSIQLSIRNTCLRNSTLSSPLQANSTA